MKKLSFKQWVAKCEKLAKKYNAQYVTAYLEYTRYRADNSTPYQYCVAMDVANYKTEKGDNYEEVLRAMENVLISCKLPSSVEI